MNHDDHKPDLSTLIDPELEARIVAWVAGEASPFEAAELARLTNEKPELAIFKRRIEAVHGLVGEAIHPDSEPLRLAPERRTKLLHALGAPEFKPNAASATNTVMLPLAVAKKKKRKEGRWIFAIAASLAVGLFTVMSIPGFQKSREMKHKMLAPALASSETRDSEMQVELPVAENVEKSAQADGEKRREIAQQYAISKAEKRKAERESMDRDARARETATIEDYTVAQSQTYAGSAKASNPASPGVSLPVPRQSLQSANSRIYGAIRFDPSFSKQGGAQPQLEAKLGRGNIAGNKPLLDGAPRVALPPSPASRSLGNAYVSTNSDAVTLSPFEVSAVNDKGDTAQNTLAGARLRTDLRDAASAVTVLTPEFLKDIQATNNQTLLQYTAGTEIGVVHQRGLDGPVGEEGKKESDAVRESDPAPAPRTARPPIQSFSEINAAKEPVSTFSLHVSDVSFRLAQAALAKGEELDRASIRPEEFYNAFSYGDPTPALAEKVSCRIEQAAHPFVQQRNLVRIAVKVAASGRDAAQPLHLTVLLDTSGSMEREDRAATIQSAMKALTSLLGPNDRLTLIGFSRQPRLLAEALTGDQTAQVLDLIKSTPAEGGTNLEEALKLGSELARRQFNAAAQNRIVLLTDGAANLGNANPSQLAASIEALRQQGIAFDACGVGLEGLDDGMLENLTRKGDGRYYVLNSPEAADAGFAKQLAGAFRPAAENVKLQVRFNPARVGNYRLIGFEQHRLREEDFRNDKVDAAELAAEEAAVAVYQVEALPQGEGELGEVYVRFRDTASGNMVERSWTLNYDPQTPSFDRATPSIQLAGTAALLAEKLQGGEAAAAINLGDLAPIVAKLRNHYAHEPRVQELVTMFEQARKLAGE